MNSIAHRVVTRGLAALVFAAPLAFQPALAEDKAMSSSQSRMATCSKQNKGLKGDEYKKAQSDCLKGETAAAAAPATPMTQQQKMAACSKQNKGKKGDDYKNAQKACLAA